MKADCRSVGRSVGRIELCDVTRRIYSTLFPRRETIRRGRRDNLLNFTRTLDKACHRQIRPSLVTHVCKSVEDYARNTRDVFHGPAAENCDSSIALHSTENNFLVRENGLEIGDDRIYRASPTASIAECILLIFSFFYGNNVCVHSVLFCYRKCTKYQKVMKSRLFVNYFRVTLKRYNISNLTRRARIKVANKDLSSPPAGGLSSVVRATFVGQTGENLEDQGIPCVRGVRERGSTYDNFSSYHQMLAVIYFPYAFFLCLCLTFARILHVLLR